MSEELVALARAGDREAFSALVDPHRAELLVHCYRMLASLQDAEDVVQETLLSAWLGLAGFEGRSAIRTWLYRIATNRCLNHLRSARRRPSTTAPTQAPAPSLHGDLPWLQPFPDQLLEGVPDERPGPEATYETREAVTLAFITVVQRLPPRQRAVLILRDVLGYPAGQTATLMDATVDSVTNALKRARATLRELGPDPARPGARPREPRTVQDDEVVDRFVTAFLAFDVEAMVELMSEDIWLRMPPAPSEYRGRVAAHAFLSAVAVGRPSTARVIPTSANTHPAWGEYRADPVTGLLHLTGIEVVVPARGRITELVRFESTVAPWFGLPRTMEP